MFKASAMVAALAMGHFFAEVSAWTPSSATSFSRRVSHMPMQAVCDVANPESAAAIASTLRSLELTGADGQRTTLGGAMGVSTG